VRGFSDIQRLQPWFAHWSWTVPADQLAGHLGVARGAAASGIARLDWDDAFLSRLPGARRFCHVAATSGASPRWQPATDAQSMLRVLESRAADLDDDQRQTPPVVIATPQVQ
jgi:hypothetical protein